MKKSFLSACVVAASLLASTSASAIVYSGSFVAAAFTAGSGSMTANYTITTDGSFGILGPSNFIGYTLSVNHDGTIRNSSGASPLFALGTGMSATASALSFDFGGFETALVFFDGNEGLCFVANPYGCAGEPSPATGAITAGASVVGYRTESAGVQVIATAGPGEVVPEPASWAMLIAGFGLTGAVLRRRRAFQTV